MTKTRHELIAQAIRQNRAGLTTDRELLDRLTEIFRTTECGCIECTD